MLVSLTWLKEYVSIDKKPQELAHSLTMAGFEVDSFYETFQNLNNVVICRIIKVEPHPNADRLKLCEVDIENGKILQIVCGAPNVKENMLAALALPGAVMKDGTVLKKNKIRGINSFGMLCSKAELGLSSDKSGIMELDNTFKQGVLLKDALFLSDTVFDISITPNRPDCLSIIGIAREIAALSDKKVRCPDYEIENFSKKKSASVIIEDKELCPRYAARVVKNVKVKESPLWLRSRLLLSGLKPINNIVDITNFVMLETCQPLHAFDLNFIADKKIIVKKAGEIKKFLTLDNKEKEIFPDMLMICDTEKPIGIAGVMGGANSEIKDSTTDILIESAYFEPSSIRRTAKKLNISTDASYRFERGIDPEGCVNALNRAALLISEIAGGEIEDLTDERFFIKKNNSIELSVKYVNNLLGTALEKNNIKRLLESIEFNIDESSNTNTLIVYPPSYRIDILRQADLAEEIARLYGYDNIKASFPFITPGDSIDSTKISSRDKIKRIMANLGFYETISYSFINPDDEKNLNLKKEEYVRILNPLSYEYSVMRTSLISSLLKIVKRNISYNSKTSKIFEISKTFFPKKNEELPYEKEMLSVLWTGGREDMSWFSHGKTIETDFYDIKGVLENLEKHLHIENLKLCPVNDEEVSFIKRNAGANVFIDGKFAGVIGEISKDILTSYDINQKVFAFELYLDILLSNALSIPKLKDMPNFPGIERDITIIIDKKLNAAEIPYFIENNIKNTFIEKIDILDVYEGEPISEGKKSLSIRIYYISNEQTLTEDMVNPIHTKIANSLVKEFRASFSGQSS